MTTDRLVGRAGKIWQAYIRGATQEAIADKYEISQARVSQIIADVRSRITPETIDSFNARTLDVLASLTQTQMDIVDGGPQPKVAATGRVVIDPATGQSIPDYSQVAQATANVVRISERAAKILGSDAAAKQDITVTTAPEDIELVQRIREWKASRDAPPQD